MRERLVPGAGTRRVAPRYHPACRGLADRRPLTAAARPPAITGGARLRLLRARRIRVRFGQRLGEDGRGGLGTGLTPSPARSGSTVPAIVFPSSPVEGCYTRWTASITVRVTPRSGRTEVTAGPDGASSSGCGRRPKTGRPPRRRRRARRSPSACPTTAVRLRSGARSRIKVFDGGGPGARGARTAPPCASDLR